jgi:hypothetical protein
MLTREEKRRKKHSEEFNKIFWFFLQSYRHKILDFSGVEVKTTMNINEDDGKVCFKKFDNGEYKGIESISTRHPNILKGVIVGKKSWGLHVKMWSEGISEGTFTKRELLQQFTDHNIVIPESFLLDFDNTILKKFQMKRW